MEAFRKVIRGHFYKVSLTSAVGHNEFSESLSLSLSLSLTHTHTVASPTANECQHNLSVWRGEGSLFYFVMRLIEFDIRYLMGVYFSNNYCVCVCVSVCAYGMSSRLGDWCFCVGKLSVGGAGEFKQVILT